MAKINRLQEVEVADADLIQQLKDFHAKNRRKGPIKTLAGEELKGGEAVVLTDAMYTAHGLAKDTPVYVHTVMPEAGIAWVAAFAQDGREVMVFMSPDQLKQVHTPA